jgi:hypothetical protein
LRPACGCREGRHGRHAYVFRKSSSLAPARRCIGVDFIEGAEDQLTATVLAKQYFDSIRAPSKQFMAYPAWGTSPFLPPQAPF